MKRYEERTSPGGKVSHYVDVSQFDSPYAYWIDSACGTLWYHKDNDKLYKKDTGDKRLCKRCEKYTINDMLTIQRLKKDYSID